MAIETELIVRVASGGAAKTIGDVAKLQKALGDLGKNAKDTTALAAQLGKAFDLNPGEVQDLAKALGQAKTESGQLADELGKASKQGQSLGGVIAGFAAGAAFKALDIIVGSVQALGQAFTDFIGSIIEVGGAAQQSRVAFETILGSAEEAQSTLADLSDFAATTPFDLPGVRAAGQQLLAFGFQNDTLTENLRRVGDVAAGVNTDFGSLATIYGKARVQGRLFAEDVNQLTERGIPIIGEFAKQFGVAESEVKNLVASGKIGFPELEQAFINMTGEGGQFSGLMEAQSKTIPGQVSNISDGFVRLQEALFNAFAPAIAGGLEAFSGILAEVGEQSSGFDKITEASERLQLALQNNPEIVEAIGGAIADLTDTAIDQIAQILDAITAFVSTEGNIEQVAGQLEAVGGAIVAVGETIQFLVALADGMGQMMTAAEGLPIVGDNIDRFLKFPTPLTALVEVFRALGEVFGALKPIVIDATSGVLDAVGKVMPVLQPLLDRVQNVLDLLGREPEAVPFEGIGPGMDAAAEGLGNLGGSLESLRGQLAQKLPNPAPDPEPIEDALKRMEAANKSALAVLGTDAANARAAILEGGGDPAKLAELEAQTLRDRLATNRTFLNQLQALQARGGLSAEEAATVADQIRGVDAQLGSDRVSLAQNTLSEKQRIEKAAADAAKAAAEASAKAAEEAAKKATDALKDQRDEEKRIAEQRQADAEKAAQRGFDDAKDGRAEARDAQRRAEDKAAQDALQADDRAHEDQRRASDAAFQDRQQAEADAFQDSQQAAAEAFQKRLDAERDQGNREFDVLSGEVERRIALEQAADAEALRALQEQFRLEDQQLERRKQVEAEVLAQRGAVLEQNQAQVGIGPLEQARLDFEAQLQSRQESFQNTQQANAAIFQAEQQAEADARAEAQRTEDRARSDERADAEDARDELRREQDKLFEDNERAISDAFESQQRANKEQFNAQQRQLDEASAQRIAAILAAAKPASIDGARRDGGPVRGGGSYLVGETGPELITPRRGGYVYTARETAAIMGSMGRVRGLSVPGIGGQGAVVRKLDELIKTVKARPAVRPQSTYNLTTPTPQADAVAIQLEELRGLVRLGRI